MSNNTKRLGFSEVKKAIMHLDTLRAFRSIVTDELVILRDSPFIEGLVRLNTPYIMEDVRIGMVVNGRARVTVNLIDYEVEAGTLVVIDYGAVIQPREVSPDFSVIGMMISPGLARTVLGDSQPKVMDMPTGVAFVRQGGDEFLIARRMLENIWDLLHWYGFVREVIHPALRAYIEYVEMLHNRESQGQPRSASRGGTILNRYIQLVNLHCAEAHNIEFYADKLCISNHYLCSVIKRSSGLTAKEWIDKALVTQAKMLLKSTDMQMTQITNRLNFPNPSFFSKYFKRLTGMTPQEYRNAEG